MSVHPYLRYLGRLDYTWLMTYFSDKLSEHFWQHTIIVGACHIWTGSKTKDGYGLFKVEGRNRCAHRYAKEMQLGERIPRSLDASHTCDHRACVDPDHTVVETHQENVARADMSRPDLRRFTPGQVREIRGSSEGSRRVAKRFNVSERSIRQIRNRTSYKDV